MGTKVQGKRPGNSQYLISRIPRTFMNMDKQRTRSTIEQSIRFRNAILQCKIHLNAECGSDHLPMTCNLRAYLWKLKRAKAAPKLHYYRLLNVTEEIYTNNPTSRYNEIMRMEIQDGTY